MIRLCTPDDMESVEKYLKDEPYGKVILTLVNAFGFDKQFQTVYVDITGSGEEDPNKVKAVYIWLYHNLLLFSKENQIDINFLEQMMGIEAPDMVAGRKDNINIVSWLLTDYNMENRFGIPDICGKDGELLTCLQADPQDKSEWCVLTK